MSGSKSINNSPYVKIGMNYDITVPQGYATNCIINEDVKTMYLGADGCYGYPNFPPGSDVGQAFRLQGTETRRAEIPVGRIWGGGPNSNYYEGSIVIAIGNASYPVQAYYPPDARAAEAYAKMKPTAPSFQAANALYELRELPGMLQQRFHKNNLRNIGSYFLALQFGWKPLLNDIRNFVKVQMNGQKRLSQLLRDNGKPVRRSIVMLDDVVGGSTTGGVSAVAVNPQLLTGFYPKGFPTWQQTMIERERWWATAQFRYWLPGGPRDVQWRARMLAAIYGLNPSPSVVYNAIPWSWLVDWFTNLGYLVENLEVGVADRLAADHFYVMRERKKELVQTAQVTFKRQNGTLVSFSGSSSSVVAHKHRGKGDPFGFNTNQNSLSGMQLAIMGALGLSRLR